MVALSEGPILAPVEDALGSVTCGATLDEITASGLGEVTEGGVVIMILVIGASTLIPVFAVSLGCRSTSDSLCVVSF